MEINPSGAIPLNDYFMFKLKLNCGVNDVRKLILQGANVNYSDSNRNTPLHIALRKSDDKLNLIHHLIASGAYLNFRNIHKRTALHYAVLYAEEVEILEKVIKRGALVHPRDIDGNSALHLAVQHNKKPFVEALIRLGADVNMENFKGVTPLTMAVENNNLEIAKVLLSSGASLLGRVPRGPLHVAVDRPVPNKSMLIELMEYGANLRYWDPGMHFSIKWAVKRFLVDPSYSLIPARTLLKCCALQYTSIKEIPHLFGYLREFPIYSQLIAFIENCMLEMQKMKYELLHKNFSLFDFVRDGFESDPMFRTKPAYKELIFNNVLHISRRYPIYAEVIAYRLGKMPLCFKCMDLPIYALKEYPTGGRIILLSPDEVFIISKLLSTEDVLNFIIAFSDSRHFGAHDFGFQNLALGKPTKRKLDINC